MEISFSFRFRRMATIDENAKKMFHFVSFSCSIFLSFSSPFRPHPWAAPEMSIYPARAFFFRFRIVFVSFSTVLEQTPLTCPAPGAFFFRFRDPFFIRFRGAFVFRFRRQPGR